MCVNNRCVSEEERVNEGERGGEEERSRWKVLKQILQGGWEGAQEGGMASEREVERK